MKPIWKVLLLKNNSVIVHELASTKFRCFLIGLIWKYIPDLTYKNRDYLIVDNN